jgi:hypothetical protein
MPAEIKDWTITIITTYDRATFKDGGIKTVADLRKYFTMFQGRGKVWGYVVDRNRPPHWQDKLTTQVIVCLEWTDENGSTSKGFSHVTDFIYFLHANTTLAKSVGYKPKIQ